MMGDAEKAIASYKDAENAAEDGDLENKAFAKLRLATLYADNSNYADLKIRKYKEALDLYNQLGDKHYQIVCLTDMGGYYRSLPDKRDSALYYLNHVPASGMMSVSSCFLLCYLVLRMMLMMALMSAILISPSPLTSAELIQSMPLSSGEWPCPLPPPLTII